MSKNKKSTSFLTSCWYGYKSWHNKKQLKRYSRLSKKQFSLQCKIRTIDERLVNYIKKTQTKKRKLEIKLNKISNKLDKWDNVTPVEAVKDPRNSTFVSLKKENSI